MSFSVGSRIKSVRGKLGVGEFAEVLGLNRKTVTRWEADEVLPDGLSLLALKRCFDCDPGWLLTGDGSKPLLDSSEQVLLENFRRCNPTAKVNLIQTSSLLAAGFGDIGTPPAAAPPRSSYTFDNAGANINNQMGENHAPINIDMRKGKK